MRRACKVTSEQLGYWRKQQEAWAATRDLDEQRIRVFPVVDDLPNMNNERSSAHAAENLELRLGGWSICIRQIEA